MNKKTHVKKFKVGMYFWLRWSNDLLRNSSDCPCLVTEITEENGEIVIQFTPFDNGIERRVSKFRLTKKYSRGGDDSEVFEVTHTSKREVEEYMDRECIRLLLRKIEAERHQRFAEENLEKQRSIFNRILEEKKRLRSNSADKLSNGKAGR